MAPSYCWLAVQLTQGSWLVDSAKIQIFFEWVNIKLTVLNSIHVYKDKQDTLKVQLINFLQECQKHFLEKSIDRTSSWWDQPIIHSV